MTEDNDLITNFLSKFRKKVKFDDPNTSLVGLFVERGRKPAQRV